MRKFFSFFLCFLLLFNSSVALATEGEQAAGDELPVTEEVTEPSEVPSEEPSETDGEASEPSEGGSEGEVTTEEEETPVEPSEGETGEAGTGYVLVESPMTVDVSENSVQAIADAVTDAEGNMSITTSEGVTISVPDFVAEIWDDYTYRFIFNLNGNFNFALCNSVGDVTNNGSTYSFVASDGFFQYGGLTDSLREFPSSGRTFTSNVYKIKWANFSIVDSDGNVLYLSDVPQSYIVSFDTGFEDLSLDDVSSDGFVAPVPVYDGYRFDGWFFDEEYSLPFTDGYEFVTDTVLYAKWTKIHTLSFVTGIDGYELSPVQIFDGDTFTVPALSREGYIYLGAFTDEAMELPFVDGSIISSDLTIYLSFDEIVYTDTQLALQQIDRLEAIIYVQMAAIIVVSALLVIAAFFRKRSGTGV